MADGNGELTRLLDLEIDLSAHQLATRSQRFSMIVNDLEITHLNLEGGPGLTEISNAATLLGQLK